MKILLVMVVGFSVWAGDEGYRYSLEAGRCQKDGVYGLNPDFLGPCGDAREINVSAEQIRNAGDLTAVWLNDHAFPNENLDGAYFPKAMLRRMDLRGASLQGANMSQSSLTSTNFVGANLTGARLENVGYWYGHAENAIFDKIYSPQSDYYGHFNGASFKNAYLVQTKFNTTVIRNVDFSGADLRHAQFINAWMKGAKFNGADLTGAWYDICTELPFSEREALKRGMQKADRRGKCKGPPH